eukprot:TRINITY_DN4068_c1_g1_i3.p1 TRINITY_DN4068_c1_g1~~TRINITY_DN4068_c1_g1_i3.p1  ORF type:complete len:289 (+),score=10.20 TRINITY_DN4068_c1_g1_i3:99-965(+)
MQMRMQLWLSTKIHPITLACRYTTIAAGLLTWLYYDYTNEFIQNVYDVLRNNYLFKHDSFEPAIASVSFFMWINFWYVIDAYLPSQKKYRIQQSDSLESYSYQGGLFREITAASYLIPIMIYDLFFPRRNLPIVAPTAFQLVSQILACLMVYDFLFFWVHVSYHRVPFMFKHIHAKHHQNLLQRSIETVRLAIPEVALDAACSIIAVNVTKAHPLSRAIYNVFIVYLLTELHCGYDMPWALGNVVPFGLWGGSKQHDIHHRVPNVYYQKIFTYLDIWYGSAAKKQAVE